MKKLDHLKNIFNNYDHFIIDLWGVVHNGIKPFVNKERCFIEFDKLHNNNIRPFYVVLMERGLKKGTPNNCDIIYEETRSLNFSNEKLFLAKVFRCN